MPVPAPTDDEGRRTETQEIAEEHDLLVLAGAHESGGEQTAEEREEGDAAGISAQGEEGHDDGDEDESGETGLASEEGVVLAAGPNGDEEGGFAQAGDALGEVAVVAVEKPLAPGQHESAKQDADGDAAGRTDPVIVESQFEEVGDGKEQSDDADAIEPSAANEGFEIGGGGLV